MWEKTPITTASGVTAKQIWPVWTYLENWPLMDAGLEWCKWCEPHSEFRAGAVFKLKVKQGPVFKIVITQCIPYQSFTDYTQFFGARMYDVHELKEGPNGLEIHHTSTMTGPLAFFWRKLVGEKVAAGIAEQTQNLIAMARAKS